MSRKKIAIVIIVVLAAPLAVLAGVFAVAQSPRSVNLMAALMRPVTGIYLHVDDISYNFTRGAKISGLHIKETKDDGFDISVAEALIHARFIPGFKLRVEEVLLTEPKFSFHIKEEKPEADPFAVFKKIPPIRLLVVKNGSAKINSDSFVYSFKDMDVAVREFNPDGGGKLKGKSSFNIKSPHMNASGILKTTLDISGVAEVPSGTGSFLILFDAGSFGGIKFNDAIFSTSFKLDGAVISADETNAEIRNLSRGNGKEKITMRNIKAQLNGTYNRNTTDFTIASFELSASDAGVIKSRASGTVKPLAWITSVRASSIDIEKIFGLLKPFIPGNYRSWEFKGKGRLEGESEGRQVDGNMIWKVAAIVDLAQGGFASADYSKAGERIAGKIELKLASPKKDSRGSFDVNMEGGDGEFLWGRYYQDFKGEKVKIASKGTFTQNPFSISSAGKIDLFQTGDYAFSAEISQNKWILFIDAKRISCPRLFDTLVHSYISQNYPSLRDMALEGEADIKLRASIMPQQKVIEGNLALRDGAVFSPENELALRGLNISLPYDLTLAGNQPPPKAGEDKRGFVSLEIFQKGNIKTGRIETPVVFAGNSFILPEPINISVLQGEIHLAGFSAHNLLFPDMRMETAMILNNINLENMMSKDSTVPLPGVLDGKFSSIIFEDGKWNTNGELVARIFGGQVKIDNLTAGNILSSSRFIRADVVFDNIDLEKATATIKVGRMTGLIKGSLKNFSMEYGQPSRFDLVIESDESRKMPKKISVDAIKNLSIIGTGSGAVSEIMSSGLNRFFRDYPYSRIGIKCVLADDIFSLRGLIHEAGIEYLVKKALIRGIDVINRNPNNSISFKDMAERVGRIFQPRPESKDMT